MRYADDAQYVLESRWLKTKCEGPPDFIYNMSDIHESFWYFIAEGWDEQLFPGPPGVYYTNPGLCYASLILEWSKESKGIIDGFYSPPLVKTEKELIPKSTNGKYYCKIDGLEANQTVYVLENGPCYQGSIKCNRDKLEVYDGTQCNGTMTAFPISANPVALSALGTSFGASSMLMAGNSQETVYTLHVPPHIAIPDISEVSGALMVTSYTLIALFVGFVALYYLYQATKTRLKKYWLYFTTMILRLCYIIIVSFVSFTIFKDEEQFAVVQEVFGICHSICTLTATMMNAYNVLKFVFHKNRIAGILLYGSILALYFGLGFPYTLLYYFYSLNYVYTPTGEFIFTWFIRVEYYWMLFTFAFDPLCSLVVIFYIAQVKLVGYSVIEKLKILLQRRWLLFFVCCSWLNLSFFVMFRALKYSALLKDDFAHVTLSSVTVVLIGINQFLSIMYIEYFPVVFNALTQVQEAKKTKFEQPAMKRLVEMSASPAASKEAEKPDTTVIIKR